MDTIASAKMSMPGWLDPAARIGHAAKGTVYASVGALALWRAFGGGAAGESGGRDALRAIVGAPLGKGLVAILAVGLAAYVVFRLSQAVLGPEGAGRGRRVLYLLSAVVYAALAIFAVRLLLGGGVEGDGGGASRLAEILARSRGPWIVGGVGAGLLVRGALRMSRPHRPGFQERIGSLQLSAASRRWVTSVSWAGMTARAIVLLSIGGSLVYAAAARGPLTTRPWLTGLVGTCMCALAVLEWTRVRYPLPDA
jgi:hypothetical protein